MAKTTKKRASQKSINVTLLKRVNTLLGVMDSGLKDTDSSNGYTEHVKSRHRAKAHHLGMVLLSELMGPDHAMVQEFASKTEGYNIDSFDEARGIILAARIMVENDWLTSARAAISQRVFEDFLDMAEHLHGDGFKDAAAVIAGSSLEAHMKRMATNRGVPLTTTDPKGKVSHKKADMLNADLVKAGAYDKNEQKQVTAWLGVRNEAAHGNYANVDAAVVGLMITGIRSFTARYPT
jgi:hypothetical protein